MIGSKPVKKISKPSSLMASPGSCFEFLPYFPPVIDFGLEVLDGVNPLIPKLLLVMEFITATEIQTRIPDNWEQNVILLCPKFLIFLGLIMRVLIISYYYYYYSWLFHLLFSEQAVLSNLCLFSMRLILFPVVRTLHILVISLWMAVDLPMFTLGL